MLQPFGFRPSPAKPVSSVICSSPSAFARRRRSRSPPSYAPALRLSPVAEGSPPSYAVEQTSREVRREARIEDLSRRLVRVVRHAVVLDHLRRVVPDSETGAGIVVARLAAASDAAQVLVPVLDADLLLPYVPHVRSQQEGALQVRV